MRILIVDDEPGARLLIRRALESVLSGEIDIAADGREALDRLAVHAYDLVVLDMLMPVLDGLETLVAIRENPATADLPVIVHTANRDELVVQRLAKLGIADYLLKPFHRERFLASVEKVRHLVATRDTAGRGRGPDSPGAAARLLELHPPIRAAIATAVERLFQHALRMPVEPLRAPAPVGPDEELGCSIGLSLVDGTLAVRLCLCADLTSAQAMAACWRAERAPGEASAAVEALGDLLTFVAVRVVGTLLDRGVGVRYDRPRAMPCDLPPDGLTMAFQSADRTVRFRLALCDAVGREDLPHADGRTATSSQVLPEVSAA